MYELVHQYAPESPAGRTAVAIIASLIGVPALVLGLIGLTGNAATGLLFLLVSVVTLVVAGQLTRGVVRQANAAPTAGPQNEREPNQASETAIETLRRRYAEGELSDEAFQRRLDQLLETEDMERTTADRERLLE
ncbi:SHOCT domain-containing protein [Halobellus clavatus]|uniref:Short C-terminal domain-containing protein n=1 Tax=Halobellus clavatus TaxID=660517 RepID=A0A1H3IVQ1_9EURY|nr:SHOCT domain-containing protein [Halobellus clavatus]SDY31816.1 Short C-terminal domain-containing protein [Halobellus clavatus]